MKNLLLSLLLITSINSHCNDDHHNQNTHTTDATLQAINIILMPIVIYYSIECIKPLCLKAQRILADLTDRNSIEFKTAINLKDFLLITACLITLYHINKYQKLNTMHNLLITEQETLKKRYKELERIYKNHSFKTPDIKAPRATEPMDVCYVCHTSILTLKDRTRQTMCCNSIVCLQDFHMLYKKNKNCPICTKPMVGTIQLPQKKITRTQSMDDIILANRTALS